MNTHERKILQEQFSKTTSQHSKMESTGLCYSSGMAAMDAVLKLLAPGDEIIATNDLIWRILPVGKNDLSKSLD